MACTGCNCLPEIATSLCSLAMTHQGACAGNGARHRFGCPYAASRTGLAVPRPYNARPVPPAKFSIFHYPFYWRYHHARLCHHGGGERRALGANKLEAELDGKPLIRRALEAVPAGVFDRVAVVTQYPAVAALAREFGFTPVRNDRPGDGLSRTVRLGTQALADCDGIVFLVADQPLLSASAVRAVVRQWREHPSCIVGAACGTRRGNPNLFPREFFPGPVRARGRPRRQRRHPAVSERYLCRRRPAGGCADVDTPEALRAPSGIICRERHTAN